MVAKASTVLEKKQQSSVSLDEGTSSFLHDNYKVGMEQADGSDIRTPTLTLIQRSSNMKDEKGNILSEKHAGSFYYKGDKKVYENPKVVILAFAKKMNKKFGDDTEKELNYLVLGVFKESRLPFIMYCRSSAIGAFKNLISEAFTQKRPLWSFITDLSTERVMATVNGTEYNYYKPKFKIESMINTFPLLQEYKNLTEQSKDLLETVSGSENEDVLADAIPTSIKEEVTNTPVIPEGKEEKVNEDQIPF